MKWILTMAVIALAFCAGCMTTEPHKFLHNNLAYQSNKQMEAFERGDNDEAKQRGQNINALANCEKQVYGGSAQEATDGTVEIAIWRAQNDTLFKIGQAAFGAVTGYLGINGTTIGGGATILAILTTLGVFVKKYLDTKKLAVANTKAIESYSQLHPAGGDTLKDFQRYHLTAGLPQNKLVQTAAAEARADYVARYGETPNAQ